MVCGGSGHEAFRAGKKAVRDWRLANHQDASVENAEIQGVAEMVTELEFLEGGLIAFLVRPDARCARSLIDNLTGFVHCEQIYSAVGHVALQRLSNGLPRTVTRVCKDVGVK